MSVRLLAALLSGALLQVGCLAGSAQAAPGDLDPSFDADGKVVTDAGSESRYDGASGVAVQSDGNIVAVGETAPAPGGLVRYSPGGGLDLSFDGDGRVAAAISPRDVAVQPDGKIVVAGRVFKPGSSTSGDFAVARYNPNGSLDTAFGSGGRTVTQFPPAGGADSLEGVANRVLLQPDGKILAAGVASATGGSPVRTNGALAVARFNPDGSLDTGFGSGGKTVVVAGSKLYVPEKNGLARQADGKIVLATTSSDGDFFVARLLPDGRSLDSSFNGGGVVRTNLVASSSGESFDSANDVAIQGDKIVAAGATRGPRGSRSDFALVRYTSNGAVDPSFDGDGKLVTDFGESDLTDATPDDSINRLAIQAGSKIVAVGCAGSSSGCTSATGDFALAAYEPDGVLDSSFGASGKVTTPFGSGLDAANAVAIQPTDGKVVTAGQAFNGTNDDFALARYFAPVPAPLPPPSSSPLPPAPLPAPALSPSGPQPPATQPLDTAKPTVSSLSISPTRFRAAGSAASISARVGAKVSYKLSEAATVEFGVDRALSGRRSHGRCVKPKRSNRRGKRCTRYVTLAGSFTHKGKAGSNRLKFRGRLRSRNLRLGGYRLRALATDPADNRSRVKHRRFRIVRR